MGDGVNFLFTKINMWKKKSYKTLYHQYILSQIPALQLYRLTQALENDFYCPVRARFYYTEEDVWLIS